MIYQSSQTPVRDISRELLICDKRRYSIKYEHLLPGVEEERLNIIKRVVCYLQMRRSYGETIWSREYLTAGKSTKKYDDSVVS